ncbi:MAG: efflux RND transporter periplasmic adaptor subunit [Stenotrophobium sp.]
MTQRIFSGIVLTLVLAGGVCLAGCTHSDAAGTAAATATSAHAADTVVADQDFNPDFVKTTLPVQQTVDDTLSLTGKLALDKQQLRLASARVAGRLGRIFVFEGQSVKSGQPLAEIYSPDYISAQNEFLLARHFRDTLSNDTADPELRSDTLATYQSAANRLKILGASDADIAALARSGRVEQYLQVRAPISGVITQRNVDPGGYLNIGDTLMTVANTNTLWLYFNTYAADYAKLKLGENVTFRTSSLPGENFSGKLDFIAPGIDPATHTLPVRCSIPNPDMRLRPEMFVSGELDTGEQSAWVVPKSAVFRIHEQDYIFIQDGAKQYRRLLVKGRSLDPDHYAITSGLDSSLPVVNDGAVLLNQMLEQNS